MASLLSRGGGPLIVALLSIPLSPMAGPASLEPFDERTLFGEIPTVFGASKYEQRVEDAPASVTIVNAADIRNYGYRTLGEILNSVRGFYLSSDRNYSYLGARGFSRPGDYNARLLLLVDGHRLNDTIYNSFLLGSEGAIDVELIERVEVIRGPSSSLYGTSAFFGVINIVTRRGRDLRGGELAVTGGSEATAAVRLTGGGQSGDLEAIGSISGLERGGAESLYFREFDQPATNHGVAYQVDGERSRSGFGKVRMGRFTLEALASQRVKTVPTASYDSLFNDPGNRTTDGRAFMELRHRLDLGEKSELRTRLHYDTSDYEGSYVSPGLVNYDVARGRWWGGEVAWQHAFRDTNRVEVGAEFQENLSLEQKTYDVTGLYLDDRRSGTNWGLYAQGEFSLAPSWLFVGGVRHDEDNLFGGTDHPRLALIYSPGAGSALKFLYGSAYRAPNYYERYYNDGGLTMKGNPGLAPETIRTSEIALEHTFGNGLRGGASLFRYDAANLISQVLDPSDGLLTFRNVAESEAVGGEFELEAKGAQGGEVRMSLTLQEAKDRATGAMLTNSPRVVAKLNGSLPLLGERTRLSTELRYLGERLTLAGERAPAYGVVDLNLLQRGPFPGFTWSVGIGNLTDLVYADPGRPEHLQDLIYQDGRSYRLRVEYLF